MIVQSRFDLDVFANHFIEQVHDVVDGLIQAKAARLQNLAPRECQQLLDQRRYTAALIVDLFEITLQSRIAGGSLLLSQFRPSQYGAYHVVEIVRDPSGKLAEGLEFLRLLQLLLEGPALRHVPGNGGHEARLAGLRVLDLKPHEIHGQGLSGLPMAEPQLPFPMPE